MKKEFEIRAATNKDIVPIKKVVFDVLKEYGLKGDESGKDKDLDDIEQNYFGKGGWFAVLIHDKKNIIGTVGLFAFNNDLCELRKMYLLKPFRGKGLGKRLLETAIRIAKEKKYKKIVLETIEPLKEATALYKKYGFTEIPPREINERVDKAFELNIAE